MKAIAIIVGIIHFHHLLFSSVTPFLHEQISVVFFNPFHVAVRGLQSDCGLCVSLKNDLIVVIINSVIACPHAYICVHVCVCVCM